MTAILRGRPAKFEVLAVENRPEDARPPLGKPPGATCAAVAPDPFLFRKARLRPQDILNHINHMTRFSRMKIPALPEATGPLGEGLSHRSPGPANAGSAP